VLPRETAAARVEQLKRLVRQVLVAPHIERYVAALVRLTATDETASRYVTYGSSPRGGQALILGAKVLALLDGRPHVAADDVERVAPAAFRHRLVLNFTASAAGTDAEQIVARVLASARRLRP
jgi:MoxR-like ATPase